jgi:hypothetical protein
MWSMTELYILVMIGFLLSGSDYLFCLDTSLILPACFFFFCRYYTWIGMIIMEASQPLSI